MNNFKLITDHKDYWYFVDTEADKKQTGKWYWEDKMVVAHLPKHKDAPVLEGVLLLPFPCYAECLGEDKSDCIAPACGCDKQEFWNKVFELPKQEEDVEELAIDFTNSNLSKVYLLLSDDYKTGFKEGIEKYLKAASKKYSEEDMRMMFAWGIKEGREREKGLDKASFEDYLQSLSPALTPIDFIPEYVYDIDSEEAQQHGGYGIKVLKIVNNVLQGRWIWK